MEKATRGGTVRRGGRGRARSPRGQGEQLEAAQAQMSALPGEKPAAAMAARLAKGVRALDEEFSELDAVIEVRFREHPHAEVPLGLPGMGSRLAAERWPRR